MLQTSGRQLHNFGRLQELSADSTVCPAPPDFGIQRGSGSAPLPRHLHQQGGVDGTSADGTMSEHALLMWPLPTTSGGMLLAPKRIAKNLQPRIGARGKTAARIRWELAKHVQWGLLALGARSAAPTCCSGACRSVAVQGEKNVYLPFGSVGRLDPSII